MQKDKVEEQEQDQEITDKKESTSTEETKETGEESSEKEESKETSEEEKLQIELSEAKDKYLRLYSEFENFRRRTAKERIDLIASANKDLIENLIPVLDDFERALKSMEEDDKSKEGTELIYNKFKKVLENKGLKKMEAKKGDDFDEELHEAITQIPAEEELAGKVVDVVENGYFLGEKVVRFAKVVTGAKS